MPESAPLDPISKTLLSLIGTLLDDNGAREWDYRMVAAVTTVTLFVIKGVFGKKGGVDWYAFCHAVVTGMGAAACVYLNLMAAEKLTGTPEPLRSVECGAPLTSLHGILPAITLGYAVLDAMDGLFIGMDFLLHGLVTFFVMYYFCSHGMAQIMSPMLINECSTMFLSLVRAKFLPQWTLNVFMMLFVVTFGVFRMIIFPYIWFESVLLVIRSTSPKVRACYPWHFAYIVPPFGAFYFVLNTYWFYKIILKVRRKFKGVEKMNELNDMGNPQAMHGKKKT